MDAELSLAAVPGRMAAIRGDAVAVTAGDRVLTWRELERRSNRMAHALAALGVTEGQFVTLGVPNGAGFIEACFACWKLGATPQPVSWRLPAAEATAIVELARPKVIVAGDDFPVGAGLRISPEALAAASDDETAPPERIGGLKAMTSGGSTGRPKLIVSTDRAVAQPATAAAWRVDAESVSIIPGPLYHSGPFAGAFSTLAAGGHVVVLPKFDPEAVLAAIARHRGTWLYQVPTMMGRIWRLPEAVRTAYDVSSLKTVWHLAAPCPAWLKEAWIGWLGSETIMELYAGTEGQAATVISGTEWLAHRGSVGRLFAGEIKIVDEAGEAVAPGVTGEVYMRPAAARGATYRYVGAEARTLPDGWESLGDMGWVDAEGYLYLADRRSDMILVGGANVYPAEVEAALEAHPLVQSSAVIGLPDEDLGAKIHAIIQSSPGLDFDDLARHLADLLVAYKRPRSFELVDYPLRDDAGKVRRTQLRAERVEAQA